MKQHVFEFTKHGSHAESGDSKSVGQIYRVYAAMLQACITTKQISSITRCKTEKSSSPTCARVDSKRFCVQQIKRDIMFFSNYDSSSSPFKLAKLCRRTLVVAITKK